MNARRERLPATFLGYVAGFASGSLATLAAGLLSRAGRASVAGLPRLVTWLVTDLVSVFTLAAVLVTLVVSLWSAARLRRLAAPPLETAPASSPATRADETSRNLAPAPRPDPMPPSAIAAPPPGKAKFKGTIGGPEPLQPSPDGPSWRASDEAKAQKVSPAVPATSGAAGSGGKNAPAGAGQDDVPLSPPTPDSERLVELWAHYLARGDGHFEPDGLKRQLDAAGLAGKVVQEDGLGDGVLGVDLGDGRVYVLPHFNSTPQEVARWFQPRAGASMRMSRVQRLVQVAVARRAGNGRLEPASKGTVE